MLWRPVVYWRRGEIMSGKVYLVGAGPGDAGLITVKGMKAIRGADVIVYDHLASESLLNASKPEAEWVDAGKCAGNHHMKQEETDRLLIERARQGQQVVRLKGGDPFIFGRGGEEAMALAKAGIDFEVIPGVSSSYAAAACCGIPVTHRRVASSFHVVTGHEDPKKGTSVLDYGVLAREEGTLVFLMGLSRIGTICESLMAHGKAADTPAAVISSGTTARQKMVTAPLRTIAAHTAAEGIRPPAILVVGDVVALQPEIAWQQQGPLSGKRILVTATGEIAGRLGERITALGGEPVTLSLIEIRPVKGVRLTPLLESSAKETWLVFTSRNGVQVFFEQMGREHLDARLLGNKKFAVIGRGTAETLVSHGYYADLVPEQSCSESLAKALCRHVRADGQVLLFRAREASDVLAARLEAAGIVYVDMPLYVTERQYKKTALLRQVLEDVDIVTFCSASAVDAFAALTEGAVCPVKAACIGPVTAAAAKRRGIRIDAVAKKFDLAGLVDSLIDMINERGEENGDDKAAETAASVRSDSKSCS